MLTISKCLLSLHLQYLPKYVNMNERIVDIIDYYKLTQTEFAQRVNVSKTLVSLIIKGQRPITQAIVDKVKSAFPDVNANWLENGEGNMIVVKGEMGNLFDNITSEADINSEKEIRQQQTINNQKNTYERKAPDKSTLNYKEDENDSGKDSSVKEGTGEYHVSKIFEPQPKIERIIIFYNDGTFSEHTPK